MLSPAMDDAALRPSVLGFLIRARWWDPLLQSLDLLLQLTNLLPKFVELSLSGSQLFRGYSAVESHRSESLLHRR